MDDQAVLLLMKKAFGSPRALSSWSENSTLCGEHDDWNGVMCSNGRVVMLGLTGYLLNGQLPAVIGSLTHLEKLFMSGCGLTGPLPAELFNRDLRSLSVIDLSRNNISGPFKLPLSVPQLTSLNLGENQLWGPIPNNLNKLTQMEKLQLNSNEFSGSIPDLSNMISLKSLHLEENALTGNVPDALGYMPSLRDLNISNNHLTGQLPSEIVNKFGERSWFGNPGLCYSAISGITCFPSPPPSPSPSPSLPPMPPAPYGVLTKDNSKTNLNDKVTQIWGYIGGAVGTFLLLLVIVTLCGWCLCAKRRQRRKVGRPPSDELFTDVWTGSNSGSLNPRHSSFLETNSDSSSGLTSSGDLSKRLIKRAPGSSHDLIPNHWKVFFTFEELQTATNNFDPANLLGEGGFGRVYKAKLPGDISYVAVKQLRIGGRQGEKEFQCEVDVLSRATHRNLVPLRGCCAEGDHRLLVYEYMANRDLSLLLHSKVATLPLLDWPARLRIAQGAANGLCYLHEHCRPPIVHRDLKTSNILLDEKFEARVADFGLAKLVAEERTHVTTKVVGTFGYLAPEYAMSGYLTEKSDVYSFGVVLFELVSGRKPVDMTQPDIERINVVDWVKALQREGRLSEMFDPRLTKTVETRAQMMHVLQVGLLCVIHSQRQRPRMSTVAQLLEGKDKAATMIDMPEAPEKKAKQESEDDKAPPKQASPKTPRSQGVKVGGDPPRFSPRLLSRIEDSQFTEIELGARDGYRESPSHYGVKTGADNPRMSPSLFSRLSDRSMVGNEGQSPEGARVANSIIIPDRFNMDRCR